MTVKKRPRKRGFGEKWWSGLWIRALESFGWETRLRRGRNYALSGRVLKFSIEPGLITGLVQGTVPEPYRVEIRLHVIPPREWRRVVHVMAQRASFAAKLLAGEMPQNIEKAFEQVRVHLLPREERDFVSSSCTCPDRVNPCKHIAAVNYVVADEFDHDPFIIFTLRGMTKENLLRSLRERRGGGRIGPHDSMADEALSPDPEVFWRTGQHLLEFKFDIDRPEVEGAVLKRLGKPRFWRDPSLFEKIMNDVYHTTTQRALELASAESANGEPSD